MTGQPKKPSNLTCAMSIGEKMSLQKKKSVGLPRCRKFSVQDVNFRAISETEWRSILAFWDHSVLQCTRSFMLWVCDQKFSVAWKEKQYKQKRLNSKTFSVVFYQLLTGKPLVCWSGKNSYVFSGCFVQFLTNQIIVCSSSLH